MVDPVPLVVVATADDDGLRVDVMLAHRVPALSRRVAKALLRQGRVRIGPRRATASMRIRSGDSVEVHLATTATAPDPPPLHVLHEDARYVYVNKPAGLHTVRIRPDDPPTLADQVAAAYPECSVASARPTDGGAVHRLDRPTSGVVAFARSAAAWAEGRDAITHRAWKLYLAGLGGPVQWPPSGPDITPHLAPPPWPTDSPLPAPRGPGIRVAAALGGTGRRGHRVQVCDDGQPAVSLVWPLLHSGPRVAVQLLSGGRHQARVHLAHLGLPIKGDPQYGPDEDTQTLQLHAWALRLGTADPIVWGPLPRWF